MTKRNYEVLLEAEVEVDTESGNVDLKVDMANLPSLLRRDTLHGHDKDDVETDVEVVNDRMAETPAHLGFTYNMHPLD